MSNAQAYSPALTVLNVNSCDTPQAPLVKEDCFGLITPFEKSKYLDMAPLRKLLQARLSSLEWEDDVVAVATDRGSLATRRMAHLLSEYKPDVEADGLVRAIERALHPSKTRIHYVEADAFALALGLHPYNVWGEAW